MVANIAAKDLGSKLDPSRTYLIEVDGRRKPSADGATVAATLANWAAAAVPGTKALILDAADGKAVGTVVADREPEQQETESKVVTSEAKVVNPPTRKTVAPKKQTAKKSTARKGSQK